MLPSWSALLALVFGVLPFSRCALGQSPGLGSRPTANVPKVPAKALFDKMEERLRKSESVRIEVKVESSIINHSGAVVLGRGGKLNVDLKAAERGVFVRTQIVSDGKRLQATQFNLQRNAVMDQADIETPKDLDDKVLAFYGRCGMVLLHDLHEDLKGQRFDRERDLPVSDFKKIGVQTLRGREAIVIEYKLRLKEASTDPIPITLWLDAETNLPVQRRLSPTTEAPLLETYSRVVLDEAPPPHAFVLPRKPAE